MIVFFSILGLIAVLIEEICMTAIIHTGLSGFYFFVFPLGAAVISAFLGWLIFVGAKLERVHSKCVIIIISILIGLVTFPLIQYNEYRMTYVNDDDEINLEFQGVPLSEYDIDGDRFTFIDYIIYHVHSDGLSIGKRGQIKLDPIPIYNSIMLVLKFLTFLIMVPICAISNLHDCGYCKKCRRYERNKLLVNVPENEFHDKSMPGDLSNTGLVRRWMNQSHGSRYYKLTARYCPECKKGKITAELYHTGQRGDYHIDGSDHVYTLNSVDLLVTKIKQIKKNHQIIATDQLDHLTNGEEKAIVVAKKNHTWLWFFLLPICPGILILISFDPEMSLLWLDGFTFAGIGSFAFCIAMFAAGYAVCTETVRQIMINHGEATKKNSLLKCNFISVVITFIIAIITFVIMTLIRLHK